MEKSRKTKIIFITAFVVFMTALFYASYDISRRTTFPGSKPQLKERIIRNYLQNENQSDSLKQQEITYDSLPPQ